MRIHKADIFAVFESTGELIRYRVSNKNAVIPQPILNSIAKGDYKDWKIVGDAVLIKNNQKKVIEHYAVKLEKGNMKKTLYFTTKGENLAAK